MELEALAAAHGFTLEELAANRERRLSPAQRERGRVTYGAVGCFSFGAVLMPASFIGGAWLLYDDYAKPVSALDMRGLMALGMGGVVLGVICAIVAVVSLVMLRRRRDAYEKGHVTVLEGPLQKVHVRHGRSADEFLYELHGRRFVVNEAGWTLVHGGARYRVYAMRSELLSLEPVP